MAEFNSGRRKRIYKKVSITHEIIREAMERYKGKITKVPSPLPTLNLNPFWSSEPIGLVDSSGYEEVY